VWFPAQVGYAIRFEDCTSDKTEIKYVLAQSNPLTAKAVNVRISLNAIRCLALGRSSTAEYGCGPVESAADRPIRAESP
jgi:hypothetical protein